MSKPRTLIQFDPDKHASSFDAMVAIDSDVDQLLQYSNIATDDVQALVYGAIFTRGIDDLKSTAIFIGGANASDGESLFKTVQSVFFGPMRVSVMMDSNGANTTASAAVVAARRHVDLSNSTAVVLAATGPVGQRVTRLLAAQGARVKAASRSVERAQKVCDEVQARVSNAQLTAIAPANDDELSSVLEDADVVFAAGTTGVQLLPESVWTSSNSLRVAVDLNAVPPLGIEGIDVMDAAVQRGNVNCYGAIGVGGTKMKIHKASLKKLFTDNSLTLDAEEIFAIGVELDEK